MTIAEGAEPTARPPAAQTAAQGPVPEPGAARGARADALYLYAVARNRSFRAGSIEGAQRLRYRDLDAVVRAVPFAIPDMADSALAEHQQVVESAMRRSTVFPMPYGVVFKDRRELIRWIEEQYLALDEALSFLDGHWEMRIHLSARREDGASEDLRDFATHVYAELRRSAHAAVPLEPGIDRILSAAFLVPRGSWVEFVERAEDLAATDPRLGVDVTGPWPAYDFVRIAR